MSDRTVQDIKDRLTIEDVVGQYVQLKKVGRSLKGLCPFHAEKTPSFIVSPEKQIAYCFGCNKGGDIFSFVQEVEGTDFAGAIKILADKAGVEMKTFQNPQYKQQKSQKEKFLDLYEQVTEFYEKQLWKTEKGKKVLEYLKNRGISEDSIKLFRLGFSPDSFDETYNYLLQKGYTKKELVQAGLAMSKETTMQKIYDRFRGRLMFPIFDNIGRIVAFGARALSKDQDPKYLNSPETLIYHKSNVLYGLSFAKTAIKQTAKTVIVEGYFDVIASYQAGVKNVVASSGTALTEKQLRILKPLSNEIILSFDNDMAGQDAARRAFEIAQNLEMDTKMISVPDGKDPADYVKEHGNEFGKIVDEAESYSEYFYKYLLSTYGTDSLAARKKILNEIIPFFHLLKSSVEKDEYVRKLAHDLDFKEVQVYDEIRNYKLPSDHPARKNDDAMVSVSSAKRHPEEILLGLYLEFPRIGSFLINEVSEDYFSDELKPIYKVIHGKYNDDSFRADTDVVDEFPHEIKEKAALMSLYINEKYGEITEEEAENEIKALVMLIAKHRYTIGRQQILSQLIEAEKTQNQALRIELLQKLDKLNSENKAK
ncbi:DNA primase [Candidatus Peregrinibacteria bacterium]|nr:DNA primase [Candidatus Peregrinibacteria bacterium]